MPWVRDITFLMKYGHICQSYVKSIKTGLKAAENNSFRVQNIPIEKLPWKVDFSPICLGKEHFTENPIISKSRFRLHSRTPLVWKQKGNLQHCAVLGFTMGLWVLFSIDLWLVSISAFLMMTIDHHDRSSVQQSPLIIKWLELIDQPIEGLFI